MTKLALSIDLERCIGCKSCEAACKAEHALGPGENRNRVVWLGGQEKPALDFLALSCQHCERPACLRACPVAPKAIVKNPVTGVVTVNESQCTGCGECVVACPYGAMGFDATDHHAVKCDLCEDRRAAGQKPACATVCPAEAIRFGEHEQHIENAKSSGRTRLDHNAFLLNPANVYLDRIKRHHATDDNGTEQNTAPTLDFKNLYNPAVVDDAKKRRRLPATVTTHPYRQPRDERQADKVVAGGCNICFNCCPTQYHLKNNKVIRVTGNEEDPLWRGKICPKSQFLTQLYNSDDRLKQPQKRVGPRGEGRFEPISWSQALDEIAERLGHVREQHGPEALGIFAGTRTGTLTRLGYIRLFTQLWGTPNFADTEAFCSESKNVAFNLTQGATGSGNSYTPNDIGSASLYLYMGDNQAESRPVHFGMVNNWRLENNARMVVVDPRLTVTASKADQWLAIRSGTDFALALALSFHILTTNQHDQTFCEQWVLGWQEWRDYLVDNAYSPAWAARITGLDESDIIALADAVATADGCVIFGARGLNQHTNGTQTNRALMYLAAITGNWARRGGTFFNFGTPAPISVNAPEHRVVTPTRPSLGTNPVNWLDGMRSSTPYAMKALITSNNPLTAWPGQARVREAFQDLDLLVHIELFRNETSAYADYILPAATGVEKGEIGRASEDRRVVWIDQVAEPPGEAKPDGWIWIELGKRFGFDDVLQDKYKNAALFWDEMCINSPGMRGCTQKRLHSVPWQWIRTPVYSEDSEEIETLYLEGTTAYGQPEGHRFPTPSGKLEFWTPALETKFAAIGLSALPQFYTDSEQLINLPFVQKDHSQVAKIRHPFAKTETLTDRVSITAAQDDSPSQRLRAQGYDTELITGRPPAPHFHSWTHYAWQAQEMWPDLYVQIHPDKARSIGIIDGQEIKVSTTQGAITARAWLHSGIRTDAVFIPIGWDATQPFHPWRSLNFLTNLDQRDPVSDHSNLKTFLCRVETL